MISAKSGRVCEGSVNRAHENDLPDHAERVKIAEKDTCACSQYFETVCDICFEEIVGFNISKSLPCRDGVVFGTVRAFLGIVDVQKSGTFHLHAIIVIAGLPRTVKEFSDKCDQGGIENQFATQLCMCVDSVVTSYLNVTVTGSEEMKCPSCDSYGTITANKKVPEATFKLQRGRRAPYPTSQCHECDRSFGSCQVLRSQIERLHEHLGATSNAEDRLIPLGLTYTESYRMTEEFMTMQNTHEWPLTSETPFGELGMLHRLFLSRIVYLTQKHNQQHVDRVLLQKQPWHEKSFV